ncbi:hypothetical protein O6P43_023285 [Quillaja saponaria]|uniref:Uncharacterized protein n=1 Tax=Quillaja saponaria TaxID=32244 RepID=A0AAD7LFP8_QUISA|nr:hypothetical protein O6P43_023285 [Quillaja saponaria]
MIDLRLAECLAAKVSLPNLNLEVKGWGMNFKVTRIGHNVLSWYREMLDMMSTEQFISLSYIADELRVVHSHAAHTQEYRECYTHISKRYMAPVGLIHAVPPTATTPSRSAYSASSFMSSQRHKRTRTNVPGPSTFYRSVDADVEPSDIYIPSPPHISQSPYVASTSDMYQQLMLNVAYQSTEFFNSFILQVPYF